MLILGPFGHLFHNIHEQHYVMHAISYAAGIGTYRDSRPTNSASIKSIDLKILLIQLMLVFFIQLSFRKLF